MRRFASRGMGLVACCAVLATAGCGRPVNESLDAVLKQSGRSRAEVFPLAGKVTIDGQAPGYARPQRVLVMLNDPTNPDLSKRPCRECNDQGEFAFGTFTKGDGVRAGKFIVTFAVLRITMQGLVGPDALKNLYNDPDTNAQIPEFNIVHEAPGRKDYAFDLKVAGREGIETPGQKALTQLRPQGR